MTAQETALPVWPAPAYDYHPDAPGIPPLRVQSVMPLEPMLARPCVAIVGARACTAYGVHVASGLAADLADAGVTIVSGGAYGIDAAAHRGALDVDGRTIAVLGCGLDRPYPLGNRHLFSRIAAGAGAVVSPYADDAPVTRDRLLARNGVIGALAQVVVVVEAAALSGSLNAARQASECGRIVAAVPGPVTSPVSAGTNALIRDRHARLVTGAADVLALLENAT